MDNSEREFLHELSNPLSIGTGYVKIIFKKLKKGDSSNLAHEDIVMRLEKCLESLERANNLINKRREYLSTQEDE